MNLLQLHAERNVLFQVQIMNRVFLVVERREQVCASTVRTCLLLRYSSSTSRIHSTSEKSGIFITTIIVFNMHLKPPYGRLTHGRMTQVANIQIREHVFLGQKFEVYLEYLKSSIPRQSKRSIMPSRVQSVDVDIRSCKILKKLQP
jgi:hypothetical protein